MGGRKIVEGGSWYSVRGCFCLVGVSEVIGFINVLIDFIGFRDFKVIGIVVFLF